MPPFTLKGRFKMEVVDSRAATGGKVDPEPVEVCGNVSGFIPGQNRVLVKRLPPSPEMTGGILRPQITNEQSDRGYVIAAGPSDIQTPPIGSIAKFSKYAEEIFFDDQNGDEYAIPWVQDIRGWHFAAD
jgi:co-chaperonin GroES (HSP10)